MDLCKELEDVEKFVELYRPVANANSTICNVLNVKPEDRPETELYKGNY